MTTCDNCSNPASHTVVEGGPNGMDETRYCKECDPGNDTKHAEAVYQTIQSCPDCGDELCSAHRLLMQAVGTSGLS